MSLKLQERSGEARRCAYCHDAIATEIPCPSCGTALHAACWLESRECPTLGCSHRPALQGLRGPDRPITVRRPFTRSLIYVATIAWITLASQALTTPIMPPVDRFRLVLFSIVTLLVIRVLPAFSRPTCRIDDAGVHRLLPRWCRPLAGPLSLAWTDVTRIDLVLHGLVQRPTLTIKGPKTEIVLDSAAPDFSDGCRAVFEALQPDRAGLAGRRNPQLVRAFAIAPELGENVPIFQPSKLWMWILIPALGSTSLSVMSAQTDNSLWPIGLLLTGAWWFWVIMDAMAMTESSAVAVDDEAIHAINGRIALAELKEVSVNSESLSIRLVDKAHRRMELSSTEDHLRRILHLIKEARRRLREARAATESVLSAPPGKDSIAMPPSEPIAPPLSLTVRPRSGETARGDEETPLPENAGP